MDSARKLVEDCPRMVLAPADAPEVAARVREQLDLVEIIARQLRALGMGSDLDDMRSAGREGLLHAARSFDPERGVPFRRWANLRIRGAIFDFVRQNAHLPRRVHAEIRALAAADHMKEALAEEDAAALAKSAQEADQRLQAHLAGLATAMAIGLIAEPSGVEGELVDRSERADQRLERAELFAQVTEILESLPDAEKHMIKRHYFEGVNFDEAAKEIGLSKSWGSRIHARAIAAIAKALEKRA